MSKKAITIYGNNFSSLQTFYDEVEEKLTKDLDWSIGRNLDAFNDILRGGFGVFDNDELITLTWLNSAKSQIDLGWDETIRYFEQKLQYCHPSNVEFVRSDLERAKQYKGETLFEILVKIIQEHEQIDLVLA